MGRDGRIAAAVCAALACGLGAEAGSATPPAADGEDGQDAADTVMSVASSATVAGPGGALFGAQASTLAFVPVAMTRGRCRRNLVPQIIAAAQMLGMRERPDAAGPDGGRARSDRVELRGTAGTLRAACVRLTPGGR